MNARQAKKVIRRWIVVGTSARYRESTIRRAQVANWSKMLLAERLGDVTPGNRRGRWDASPAWIPQPDPIDIPF